MMPTRSVLDKIYALKATDKSEDRFEVAFEDGQLIWNFEIEDLDKLGVLILGLDVKVKVSPRLSLLRQSEVLRQTLTYLEEDFSVVEHDPDSRTVILRSNLPRRSETAVHYYEIVLSNGDQLSFRRYSFDRVTAKRQSCAANLARANFERLIGDFESLFS
jgi:hypothetical protein